MKKIIVALIGFYLISLVFTAPANHLYEKVKHKIPTVLLSNINGNLWRGQGYLSLAELEIGSIEWQFSPSNLLYGKVGWHFSFPQLFSNLNFAFYPWNTQTIQVLKIHGSVSGFTDLYPFLEGIQASLAADLSDLNLTDCKTSKGSLMLKDVVIAGLKFGTINGQLTCNNGLYAIVLNNTDSKVLLKGVLNLSDNRTYKLNSIIKTTDQHTLDLLSTLLTKSSEKMSFTFIRSGNF